MHQISHSVMYHQVNAQCVLSLNKHNAFRRGRKGKGGGGRGKQTGHLEEGINRDGKYMSGFKHRDKTVFQRIITLIFSLGNDHWCMNM